MSNARFGQVAAWVAGIATILFALAMLIPDKTTANAFSCASSIFISFGFLSLTCAFASTAKPERKSIAFAGVAFAAVYSTLICLVYFTQLTTVLYRAASEDILNVLAYQPGSWLFNIDLFGYGLMSISCLLIGLSVNVESKADSWMQKLLMIHIVFAFSCMIAPVLNAFSNTEGANQGIDMGTLALEFWCIYFTPIMLLAAGHFKKKSKYGTMLPNENTSLNG
ncbi:MAG TPA: hypothetical protein VHT96_08470 [Clostridia bacterium]|nr:hypothetical protein [Clostridia bacterium]